MENISELADSSLIRTIISAYADRECDVKHIGNYLGDHGITCCIPYKKIQRTLHEIEIKSMMARQDLLLRDSLHGSNAVFAGRQSDMKRAVATILDLCIWHV